MRPVRLTLKGFTSFKTEATVELADLDRFAICGPTGAGKSSLLDGLTFALFAKAPRVGAGALPDLIALGGKSFALTLDFRVGDRLYRVARLRRRSGSGSDQLEREVAPGRFELAASGKEAVTRAVEGLLGLNYDQFTQAVFLPQGQFVKFLKAKPSDQRELLNDLLRLLVYQRMQQRANKVEGTLAGHRDQLKRRLEEDFEGVTPEAREALSAARDEQQRILDEAERHLPALLERRETLCRGRAQTIELETKQRELAELQAAQPRIDALRREAEAAGRAVGVVPLLDQEESARQEHARRRQECGKAEVDCARRAEASEKARAEHSRAAAEAAGLPALREQRQRLAEALGKVALRDQLARQFAAQQERQQRLTAERAQRAAEAEALARQTNSLADTLERAAADLAAIGYDEKSHRHLDAVREQAVHLQGERKHLADALRRAEQTAAEAVAADQAAAQARLEAAHAEEAKRCGDAAHTLAVQALRAAEDAHRAAHLRAGLQPGQPCPVCRRDVTAIPDGEPVPELAACRAALDAATKEQTRAARAAGQKDRALAAAEEAARSAHARSETERAGAAARQTAVQQAESALEERVGDLLADVSGGPIEERIAEAVRRLTALSEQHRQASERLTTLQNNLALTRQKKGTKDAEVARLEREAGAAGAEVARTETALAEVRREIQAAAGTDDPAPEASRVEATITRLDQQLTQTERAAAEANSLLLLARDRVAVCTREATAAEKSAQEAAARAAHALAEAGFTDAAAARSAFRAPARLKELEARLREHDARLVNLGTRVTELEGELQGRRVSDEEVRQAETEHDDCRRRQQEAGKQVALLVHRIEQMDKLLTRAEELRKDLTAQEQRHRIYHQLAQDLRSDRFQAYLLEETLTALVQDASTQLARLTGDRYGLEFVNDRIVVIDHDNAGEQRAIDTLSGGETFLASLSLALALSEQVQKAVGAVRLDCLFIDEGFGSLDPEALRVASDAIHGLQVGGRMVGIITHIPALQEEFDQRVLVSKEGGTSRVQVVR